MMITKNPCQVVEKKINTNGNQEQAMSAMLEEFKVMLEGEMKHQDKKTTWKISRNAR